MSMQNGKKRICVVGGGPAGMMAAGTAQACGADVTLFEHSTHLGKKLAITGKGRCNVTNACEIPELLKNITRNSKFLYSVFYDFSPNDTISFFENAGVKLKVERGARVFPASDKAKDIVEAMRSYCRNVRIAYENVKKIKTGDGVFEVITSGEKYTFDRVILATGGKSYPLTGSDGSGYRLAMSLGHSVTELRPSLIPLTSQSKLCPKLQGLSLKNIAISIVDENGKVMYEDFGEMMFTHFGVTGPVILSASAHLRDVDISNLTLRIDLKPALDERTLDNRLLNDFSQNANKDFINALGGLLPSKLIEPFVDYVGIDGRRKVNSITKEERKRILCALKSLDIPLNGMRPIKEAIITSGGIEVKEISPKNMQSKLVPGLYFAGEMIDVDAYTGGFNLQIAFATGHLAGSSAACD